LDKTNQINNMSSNTQLSTQDNLIEIPHSLSVRQLAELLHVSAINVIKQLMKNGIMANINQTIDYQTAAKVASFFDLETRLKSHTHRSETRHRRFPAEKDGNLKLRPPIVTIMGHVNHGKTKLLDAIRQTNIVASEAGGITQHIGAYQVEVNEQKITFLDTPGHEAFTAMRARGAQVTDIVILVVAADDGVMPQTLEAIDHVRAASVPIVVAINKIDKSNANPELVKQQLADAGLVIEEWGGDTVSVEISAKEKTGISELLENLLLVAEMEELKANPAQPAHGVVVEATLDKTKGPLATILVHNGTLRLGDTIVAGATWGRVKAMFNDFGKRVRKAEPDEREARTITSNQETKAKTVSLNTIYEQIRAGAKELNIILKTDVQGSIEPIINSLQQSSTEDVTVRIIRSGSGNITESDVMLAVASKGLIIGFNTGVETGARRMADVEGIDIRHYDVIYAVVDDINKALQGMLEPTYTEIIEGRGEVIAVFSVGKKGNVAGVRIIEGKVSRDVSVRLRRNDQLITESTVNSLKRFKESVKEITTGYECGIGIKDFNDFEIGDILEFYSKEQT
jgi:translation initiation factor IF-2